MSNQRTISGSRAHSFLLHRRSCSTATHEHTKHAQLAAQEKCRSGKTSSRAASSHDKPALPTESLPALPVQNVSPSANVQRSTPRGHQAGRHGGPDWPAGHSVHAQALPEAAHHAAIDLHISCVAEVVRGRCPTRVRAHCWAALPGWKRWVCGPGSVSSTGARSPCESRAPPQAAFLRAGGHGKTWRQATAPTEPPGRSGSAACGRRPAGSHRG